MVRENEIRPNEVAVEAPEPVDAGLVFIGRVRSPWTSRMETPRQGRHDGPLCAIEIFEPWVAALKGVERFERLEVLYWLDRSRRDLVLQSPASNGEVFGTFSIRSPVRPNPIGTSIVRLEKVEGAKLFVRGMDCLDGTPLLDIKPDRTLFRPIAPPQKGDFEKGEIMFATQSIETGDKPSFYRELAGQLEGLLHGERDFIANAANFSALVFDLVPDLNWAGFYFLKGNDELVLGPFQGKVACVRIPVGKGVCGTAVAEGRTQRVADVHAFPGHIACDAASRSELVVPLVREGRVLGVLDLDSPSPGRFDGDDQAGFEALAALYVAASDF